MEGWTTYIFGMLNLKGGVKPITKSLRHRVSDSIDKEAEYGLLLVFLGPPTDHIHRTIYVSCKKLWCFPAGALNRITMTIPCLFCANKLTRLTNVSATVTKNLLSQVQTMQPSGRIPLPVLHTIVFTDDESMWGAPYQVFDWTPHYEGVISAT